MSQILYAVAVLGIMGLLFGLILGVASKIFAVEVDERLPKVQECLPGANCGGCGYPGCGGLAAAIVAGKAPVNGCPVGGAAVAEKVAAVMGVEVTESEKMVAHVHCNGGCNAVDKASYEGLEDCAAALRVAGGPKACRFACIGLGTCEKACPFNAIHVSADGVAVVDSSKCTACQKCIAACPQHIIDLVPEKKQVHVNCSSKDKGPEVMKVCTVGCIGCKMCEKTCKFDAIHVIDGVAVIDYDKCKNCKMCTKVCPRNTIEPVPTNEEKEKFKAAQKAMAEKAKAAGDAGAGAAAKAEGAAEKVKNSAKETVEKDAKIVAEDAKIAAKDAKAAAKEVMSNVKNDAEKVADKAADAASDVKDKAEEVASKAKEDAEKVAGKAANAASDVKDKAEEVASKAKEDAEKVAGKAANAASDVKDKAEEVASKAKNGAEKIVGKAESVADKAAGAVKKAEDAVTDAKKNGKK